MNKKLIVGIILLLLIIIIGLAYYNEGNKANSEIPNINSHLQNGNDKYNQAVTYLNAKNYSQTIENINESYKEYLMANESNNIALSKSIKNNQSLQVQYFNLTKNEIEYKINACINMFNGLNYVNTNPSKALSLFKNSDDFMGDAKEYSDKRKQLEEQYPDKFIK